MHVQIIESLRDLDVLDHRATEHADLSVELLRHVKDDLQAMDGRRKRGDDDAPFSFSENLFKGRDDGALRRRAPGHGRVGRIRQEREHALLPVAAQRAQINRLADDGRLVNLVIACVYDRAERRRDGEREAINERVRGADELDLKDADLCRLARFDAMQQHTIKQVVLF